MSSLKLPVSKTDHVQGDLSAKCVVVEYGDYECSYCREASFVIPRLRHHFEKNLLFVFRHFPLTNIHPLAEPAAEAAEFAGHSGMFWEMHDALYDNQERLGEELLLDLTTQLGLNAQELLQSLSNGTYRRKIQEDFDSGVRSGVNGTPTFFINGLRYDGSANYESLAAAISEVLQ